jgi:hypothetical protein
MEQRPTRAERYRQLANRYADLAKAAELDFMGEFYRKTAVRYVLMAEDVEKWPDPLRGGRSRNSVSLWDRAEHFLAESRQAS